jgi:8-oxo-dGTP pyrophosphatase MutT (NUDIX family)
MLVFPLHTDKITMSRSTKTESAESQFDSETSQLYNLLERLAGIEHIKTSVGVILTRLAVSPNPSYANQPEVLLVYRPDRDSFGNPAGHLEPGESLLDAVIREVEEETTLTPKDFSIDGIQSADLITGDGEHQLFVIFQGNVSPQCPRVLFTNDEDIQMAIFLPTNATITLLGPDIYNPGSNVTYCALTNPPSSPEEIVQSLIGYFHECGIPESILNE